MDANGQKFCMLADAGHWQLLNDPSGLEYDETRRSLRLARQRREISFSDDKTLAEAALEITPQARDAYGNRARVTEAGNAIFASGLYPGVSEIYTDDSETAQITDLVMGFDDVLYIAIDGRVMMHDRRERWEEQNLLLPAIADFNAWRMTADPVGGVWILDRDNQKLARLQGMPLHRLATAGAESQSAGHCELNTNPPRIQVLKKPSWDSGETPVAITCNENSQVVILSWVEGESAAIRLLDKNLTLTSALQLSGSSNPYSLQWINPNQIAMLLAGVFKEAPVYNVNLKQSAIWPVGDLYPLKNDFTGGPFLHGLDQPPHYPTASASRALHRLSFPFYGRLGQAINNAATAPLDSGQVNQIWHRLYLEAVIPEGCGIKVWLAASEKPVAFAHISSDEWFEHRFGNLHKTNTRSDTPVAVWENFASEIPHHTGLLPCTIEKNKAGLFSVLIQRSSRRVRALKGRYLQVQVELSGQGHETPEIYALRAYGTRFSYIDEYLPELYQETTFEPEADETGDATTADFYGRFVANFEGLLTSIEDRVAQAHLLTDPATVPISSLPWLASWIGQPVYPTFAESIQREFLQSASELYRWHGTLRGLKLALDIATEGGIRGGEIIVIEDFRLRRTFASIIGADLVVEDDPLTAGGSVNSNSFVGDTLFIGDESKAEFLALFNADLDVDLSEQAAIDAFFDNLAHRITVLVHESVEPQDLGLIKSMAAQETPAHVEVKVLSATNRFLVGMASLVGVDSYLARRIGPQSARVGDSRLGRNNYVKGPAAFDGRLQGLGSGVPISEELKPLAFAPGLSTEFGEDFTLDGSESRAYGGRSLTQFNWEYKGKGE